MRHPRVALLVSLLLVSVAAPCLRAEQPPGSGTDVDVETAPVELDGTVLFHVRGTSSFPAAVRARGIRTRLVEIARDATVPVDSLHLVENEGGYRVLAGERPILGIFDADASLEGISTADLAATHLLRVRQAITDYRAARSRGALQRSAGATVVATLILIVIVGLIVRLWRWFDRYLNARLRARIHSVGIQSFEVMRADRIFHALRGGLFGLRTVVFLILLLFYTGYVLARWPWTRGLSRDLTGFVLAPVKVLAEGVVTHIPSLVFLVVLFLVFRFLLKVFKLFFEAVERGTVTLSGFDADWAQPTYKIARVAVVAFGLIVAYPYIPGSQSAAFKGVSLFIGVIFSLGSSSAVSNIVAGYMMTYRRAFRLGDRVKIGDFMGDVIEMRLQVTHLRSTKNEEIVIPNSQILGGEVVNFSSLARVNGLILHTEVGIGYESPWRQVEAMLHEAARRTPGLTAPFVLLKRLGDFAITYELNATCEDVKAMFPLYAALHRNILDVFNEYGVQIMTPAYEGDPPEPKIVRPKDWYMAPASSEVERPALNQAERPAPTV